jgi:hypothetical protein
LWRIGLRALLGLMVPDGTAGDGAEDAVVAGEVPDRSTNQSALDAAFRLCRRAGANDKHEQQKSGQQSGHLILSAVMLVVGYADNTPSSASFREEQLSKSTAVTYCT